MSFEFKKPENFFKGSSGKESFDDRWYDRFLEAGNFSDIDYFGGRKDSRDRQKELFILGKLENPELDYPDLESFNFAEKEEKLLKLKEDIKSGETNDIVRRVYIWKINEKLAELRMMKCARDGKDARFLRYSRFIYGEPSREIYEYTISQVRDIINRKMYSRDQDISDAAKRINAEIFQELMEIETEIEIPRTKKGAGVERDIIYNSEDIKLAFESALIEMKTSGWRVIVQSDGYGSAISVSQENKTVNIPEGRYLKGQELEALVAHEIKTHVARREKGERSRLKILGLGLDRFLKGEEGVATFRQQEVEGMKNFAGFEKHFAIALACGADGKKRNFREVFETLKNLYTVLSAKKSPEERLNYAKDKSWKDCVRIFRGTTCKTPGACFTKDIVYREGNIGIWNLVNEGSEEVRRFSVGKYDPNNPRHIWVLDQLGITEEDLRELES